MPKGTTSQRAADLAWVLRSAALFLPLLLLMAAVNLALDPASLFRRGYERAVARIVTGGHNAANLKNMDDRLFEQECARNLPYTPGTLVLGASRCLQVTARITGDPTLFNAGVTNGDLRDMVSLYAYYRELGKTPRRVILMTDYCLFNPARLDARAFTTGYEALAERTGTQPLRTSVSHRWERVGQLISPLYFQASLAYLETGAYANEGPQPTDDYEAETDMRRADGSYSYNAAFRARMAPERMATDWLTAWDIPFNMGAYDEDSPVLRAQFEAFVAELQADGVEVVFLLPPINPYMYDLMAADADYSRQLALEDYFRTFAAEHGIDAVGSYDARAIGLTENDFYDALHCSMEATARYWAADVPGGAREDAQ